MTVKVGPIVTKLPNACPRNPCDSHLNHYADPNESAKNAAFYGNHLQN